MVPMAWLCVLLAALLIAPSKCYKPPTKRIGSRKEGLVAFPNGDAENIIVPLSIPVPESDNHVNIKDDDETYDNKNNFHKRVWTDSSGKFHHKPDVQQLQLKVVTYNILGPLHGESSKHSYAAVAITKWIKRRDKLIDELRNFGADVLCLQEISSKALRETFIPALTPFGLDCAAFAPSSMATEQQGKGKYAHREIGCAIFIRKSKLKSLASKRVYLRDFAPLEVCQSEIFKADVQSLWNSMAMIHVQLVGSNQTIIVGNTHLYWNPVRADIKTVQTMAVMQALKKFDHDISVATKGDHLPPTSEFHGKTIHSPLILCGDFNTMPDMGYDQAMNSFLQTAPFEILSNGYLDVNHPQHPDKWFVSLGRDTASPRLGHLETAKRLHNSYYLPEFTEQKPMFTTKTDDFQGWIDHIWTSDDVRVDMVFSPPICSSDLEANKKAREFSPIPNKHFHSDHIPLGIIASFSNL